MTKTTGPVSRTAIVNGKEVRYKVLGVGSPLILVHGLSGSSRWWRRNIKALAAKHEVYLVDLPGYGSMRGRSNGFQLQAGADWLRRFMDAVRLDHVSLVGHSMGGYIVLAFAASYPERVDKLVLVAPAGLEMRRALLSYLFPLLRITFYTSPFFFPILFRDALTAGPFVLLRSAKELLAQNVHRDLNSIQIPVLMIWGANDTLVSPKVGDLLKQDLLDARLVILKRTGHVPMFDRPKVFNSVVLEFLAEA